MGMRIQILMRMRVASYIKDQNTKLSTLAILTGSEPSSRRALFWQRLVSAYSCRRLTKEGDVLPALSGLARKFGETGELGNYIAGLWTNDLPGGLLWECQIRPCNRFGRRSLTYRAPSCSWASLALDDLRVKYPAPRTYRNYKKTLEYSSIEILEASCVLPDRDADPTGSVIGGHLLVRGLLCEAKLFWRYGSVRQNQDFINETSHTEKTKLLRYTYHV